MGEPSGQTSAYALFSNKKGYLLVLVASIAWRCRAPLDPPGPGRSPTRTSEAAEGTGDVAHARGAVCELGLPLACSACRRFQYYRAQCACPEWQLEDRACRRAEPFGGSGFLARGSGDVCRMETLTAVKLSVGAGASLYACSSAGVPY